MHCIDVDAGKPLWRHDLWKEFEPATFLNHGYSASPYVHKDTVIVIVGGKGHGIVAFDKKTGDVKWQKHDFDASYATPKLIDVDGQPQLLCFMAKELIAINPDNGELYWEFKHGNPYGQNITMPVDGADNIIFISSIEQGGSRALKLTRSGGKTEVEELWHNRKIRIHHQNAIRIGDFVYASTGGPDVWQAININTGDVAWRERGFAKSNALYADGQMIVIDEDGNLGIATACPEFFQVRSKVQLLGSRAWTVPTLVDTTLYLRDSAKMVALDIGAKS
ncbi:MAG: PQQ-binding-like beta-propeller repeat protein [Planctomycetes bacterium]|nr:PQQ-binding-like beta-propeller repeat protein [Planctomycetota bacterium]